MSKKNHHKELLVVIPEIYSKDLFVKMMEKLFISAPKAVVAAFIDVNGMVFPTIKHKKMFDFTYDNFNKRLSISDIDKVLKFLPNMKIAAIKKFREITALGLRESKDVIDYISIN